LGRGICGVIRIATHVDDPNHQVALKIIDLDALAKKYSSSFEENRDASSSESSSSGGSSESGGSGEKSVKNGILREVDKEAWNEFRILRRLDHPNIVQVGPVFLHGNNELIGCLEYVKGESLLTLIQQNYPFKDKTFIRNVFYQLVDAVAYCHSQKVIHGDIKCDNIVVRSEDLQIKLIDFGFSQNIEEVRSSMGGTDFYAPPHDSVVSIVWDSWGVGIVFFVMLYNKLPFSYEALERGPLALNFPNEPIISSEEKEILLGLLTADPKKRFTVTQILKKLSQPQKQKQKQKQKRSALSRARKNGSFSTTPLDHQLKLDQPKQPLQVDAAGGPPSNVCGPPQNGHDALRMTCPEFRTTISCSPPTFFSDFHTESQLPANRSPVDSPSLRRAFSTSPNKGETKEKKKKSKLSVILGRNPFSYRSSHATQRQYIKKRPHRAFHSDNIVCNAGEPQPLSCSESLSFTSLSPSVEPCYEAEPTPQEADDLALRKSPDFDWRFLPNQKPSPQPNSTRKIRIVNKSSFAVDPSD